MADVDVVDNEETIEETIEEECQRLREENVMHLKAIEGLHRRLNVVMVSVKLLLLIICFRC